MTEFDSAYLVIALYQWLHRGQAECRIAKNGDAIFRISLYEPELDQILGLLRSLFSAPGRDLVVIKEGTPFVQVGFPTAGTLGLRAPGWYCNRLN